MSRVITFSRFFPKGHPREGKPTTFVERLWRGLMPEMDIRSFIWSSPDHRKLTELFFEPEDFQPCQAKIHTIRSGKRWKAGDIFSPRVWSDKPYNSKQIIVCPDLELYKVKDIEINKKGVIMIDGKYYSCDPFCTHPLALNDGLSGQDFRDWFAPSLPLSGQILLWIPKELPY